MWGARLFLLHKPSYNTFILETFLNVNESQNMLNILSFQMED